MKRFVFAAFTLFALNGCTLLTKGSCGDEVIDTNLGENCDDGNDAPGDGCDEECKVVEGFACPRPGEPCVPAADCGNGVIELGETCDDGNEIAGDGCDSLCQIEPECGNGNIEEGEECEDGNQSNTDACVNCQNAFCGDGFVQAGTETCDPPDGQECSPQCLIQCDSPDDCQDNDLCTENEDCVNNECVNDVVDFDDGDQCTSDSCDPALGVTNDPQNDGFACDIGGARDICLAGACVASLCGDGFVDTLEGEQCDDGNNTNTDTCPNDCTPAVCGDGDVEGAEACDDNNTTNGDGCDQNCQTEFIVADCDADPAALANAIANNNQETIIVQADTNDCDIPAITINNKTLTITSDAANRATLNVTGEITFTGNTSVILENLIINSDFNGKTIGAPNNGSADVAFINVQIQNLDNSNGARAIQCDTGNNFLLDRTRVQNSAGDAVIEVKGTCRMIIANSLIVNNPVQNETIRMANAANSISVVFSTFFNNPATIGIANCGATSSCLFDSIAASDVGSDPLVNQDTLENSAVENENTDPALDSNDFRITNNSVKNIGNTNPNSISLSFDPQTIVPGINLFNHDFLNAARPQGAFSPGALEEP